MALAGGHGRSETNETDDDENDGPGVAEVEVAAAHFGQQKKHTDGDNDDGAHEASNGATLAIASNTVAHLSQPPEGVS
jgi:hypothetical protein